MSAAVAGARRLVGAGGPSIGDRLRALDDAAGAARGRLDDALLDRAEAVVRRGSGRLALSGQHTVVALAGATGSGKSSTFNAVVGGSLAPVGVRRPTTSTTLAAVWGDEDASELLAWLDVREHHRVAADDAGPDLDGLVLLDLPDHDSTELAHHLEVDRLVELVDAFVWVVDPQKYADAALHDRYLRPMATHRDVMVVVLNHVDEVAAADRGPVLTDLRRVLAADGLSGVPLLATSARTGEGLAELRSLLVRRVRDKRTVAARLAADVAAVSARLAAESGTADPGGVGRSARAELDDACADAAGVPTVVRAVERSVVRRGSRHTGWPVTAWVSRLRPDPLRRLHLDLGPSGRELTGLGRASVPRPTPVQRARVDTAVRALADRVGADLTPAWAEAVRRAAARRREDLEDALDRAVVGTDLAAGRVPVWWRVVRLLQVLLVLAAAAGLLWLAGLALLGYFQVAVPATPRRYGLPLPTWLVVLGAVGGLVLALLGGVVNRWVARARARAARRRLRAAIAEVTDALVLAPVEEELAAYDAVRRALRAASR